MKIIKRVLLIFLTISFFLTGFNSFGWAQESAAKNDQYNMLDLLIARPLGIVSGVIGTGVFVLSLPFTLPTRSVEDSFKIFVVEPFKFSFVREFPDENI